MFRPNTVDVGERLPSGYLKTCVILDYANIFRDRSSGKRRLSIRGDKIRK